MQKKVKPLLIATCLTALLSCSYAQPKTHVTPPAEFTIDLPAPPAYTAGNRVDALALDDQRRMTLLGQCTVANNAKAEFIRGMFPRVDGKLYAPISGK